MLVVIAVELVNLAILTTNHTIMDIIMNFLALVIIADFDDFFFQSVELEVMGNMIQEGKLELFYGTRELSDVLQTERTSSSTSRFKIEQNRIDHSEKNHPTKAWKKNCEKGRKVNKMHFPKIDPDKIAEHRERMEVRMEMKTTLYRIWKPGLSCGRRLPRSAGSGRPRLGRSPGPLGQCSWD